MPRGCIYVITHKPLELAAPKHYQKLYVGACKLSEKEKQLQGYVFDDTGDNISAKNSNYCELTGLYWLWKNCSDEIVGICHYRRFFSDAGRLLPFAKAEQILNDVDAIVAKRWWLPGSVQKQFEQRHSREDLKMVRDVIQERCPQYVGSFDKAMAKGFMFPYNMMVCRKEIFDGYCEWLFGIMEECEKHLKLAGYDAYQQRVYGFLSERLWLVYLIHHKLKVAETEVMERGLSMRVRVGKVLYDILSFGRRIRDGRLEKKGVPYWE